MRPVTAGHRRVERRARGAYAGQGAETVVDLKEKREQLFLRLVGLLRVDRHQVAAVGREAEVLVFQMVQALAQHRGRAQQHDRDSHLHDRKRFLRARRL